MSLLENINQYFKGLDIGCGLFYKWDTGIRFELSSPESYQFETENSHKYNEEYFEEVHHRAVTLFEAVFEEDVDIHIVYQRLCWKRQRLAKANYVFKQIKDLDYSKIEYKTLKFVDSDEPDKDNYKYKRLIVKSKVKNVNYSNVLQAISNMDFPTRMPSIAGEVFFINDTKKIILNMYDDRGMDIIANRKETLERIYQEYNEWILDYDREKIDAVFNS